MKKQKIGTLPFLHWQISQQSTIFQEINSHLSQYVRELSREKAKNRTLFHVP